MYKASIQNSNAGVIELNGHDDRYQVISITGLNPAEAQINTIDPAGVDGQIFNSSRLMPKNIVITLRITGDVEANRLDLYRYFTPGDKVRFLYQNEHRNVYIDGTIETAECGLFSMNEIMQVSIICVNPYFQDTEETEATWSTTKFNAANDADASTGFVLTFTVSYPANKLVVDNTTNGETLTISGALNSKDAVTIDTREDSFGIWIIRDGIKLNGMNMVVSGSVFPQLAPMQTNEVGVVGKYGSVTVPMTDPSAVFRKQYRGV